MPNILTDVEQVIKQIQGVLPKRLFVLAGPSGVGKNTIIKELLANHPDEMGRVRTYTTRERRHDEVDGDQYHFVSMERFRELALAGKLMEADETTVGHDVYGLGRYYSMPNDVFEELSPGQHLVLAEVDVVGTQRLRERYPNCVTIFITAPPVALLKRIEERHDETMDSHSLLHRMQTAREQIRAAKLFDYVVYNRDGCKQETVTQIENIIRVERMRVHEPFDLEAVLPPGSFDMLNGHDLTP